MQHRIHRRPGIRLRTQGCLAVLLLAACFASCGPQDPELAQIHKDLRDMGNLVRAYQATNDGKTPDSLERLLAPVLDTERQSKRYLDNTVVPKDPFGNEYVYLAEDGTRPWELWCYGKDGAPGGYGKDGDVNYRMVVDAR